MIFEVDYYAAAMPPHWRGYGERRKKEGRQETEGARAWAVGQAVAFRQSLALLAHRARAGDWPEFAEMDCYGCHHALKEGSWRQQSPRARLGLAQWSPPGFAMLRHLVAVLVPEESAALQTRAKHLAEQIAKISQREAVAAAATGMLELTERIVPEITRARLDESTVKKLADLITADIAYLKEADLQSNMQAALALNALMKSLARGNPALEKKDLAKAIDDLYRHLDPPERFDPRRLTKQMEEFKRYIR
jgi:hypothetical protein